MSETPGRPRRRWKWLVRGLAAMLWLAVLGFLWWWLPFPARTNLPTPDKLLLLGFSADGETLVTVRPAPPEVKTGDDALAAFILRGISPHYSGPIQAWDARTGKERARFAEDWGHIAHVGLAPKGDFLAADDGAGRLKVWDLQTGQERGVLKAAGLGTYDERHTFWFSPDGRTLAYKAARHKLTLWDTTTGTDRATLPGNVASPEVGASIVGLLGSPLTPGHFAALAKLYTEGTREVWVWSVAFSPDSKTVAIGPLLWPTVTLWDVSNRN
jgi:WD40 repeat protein